MAAPECARYPLVRIMAGHVAVQSLQVRGLNRVSLPKISNAGGGGGGGPKMGAGGGAPSAGQCRAAPPD